MRLPTIAASARSGVARACATAPRPAQHRPRDRHRGYRARAPDESTGRRRSLASRCAARVPAPFSSDRMNGQPRATPSASSVRDRSDQSIVRRGGDTEPRDGGCARRARRVGPTGKRQGPINVALTTLKIATFAPMPRAMVMVATVVKNGARRNSRTTRRPSRNASNNTHLRSVSMNTEGGRTGCPR